MFQRDIPAVQGCILLIVLFFLVVNTLVDIACAMIDPRIKYGAMRLGANTVIGGTLFVIAVRSASSRRGSHTDPVMDANLMVAEEPPGREFWFGTDAQGATSIPRRARRAHLAHRRDRSAADQR